MQTVGEKFITLFKLFQQIYRFLNLRSTWRESHKNSSISMKFADQEKANCEA